MHLCQRSSDHITINTTCSLELINWSVFKVANLDLTKGAVLEVAKTKSREPYNKHMENIADKGTSMSHQRLLSPKPDTWSFLKLSASLGTAILLAQPERMPIRNTDVHNLCGMDPRFVLLTLWQLSFVSHSWCICILAQSSERKACRSETQATANYSSPRLRYFSSTQKQ